MKLALVNLEIAFYPCLSIITWSSLKIPKVCAKIEETIQNAEIFLKEVTDMKEARVDEVFESISETTLLQLDEQPKSPEQFLADNLAFRDKIAIDLEVKSSIAEKAVFTIINKFMDLVTDPTVQDIKYEWLDLEKMLKQAGSESKLIQGPFEPGIIFFQSIYEDTYHSVLELRNDLIKYRLWSYRKNK